jgi:hypothetical protein
VATFGAGDIIIVANLDPLAVYGAAVATTSIAWQVFTWWHKGAKLRGNAVSGMIEIGGPTRDNNTYIGLDISNVGDASTTITSVALMGHSYRFSRLLRRTEVKAAIVNHSLAQTIPHVLPSGGRFMSRVIQTPEIEQWSRDHVLYMGVCHSMRRRPYLVRVKAIPNKSKAAV